MNNDAYDSDIMEITVVPSPVAKSQKRKEMKMDPDIIEVTCKPLTYHIDPGKLVDLTSTVETIIPKIMKKTKKKEHSPIPEKFDNFSIKAVKKETNTQRPQPFHVIKRNHRLFFSYDPRGVTKGTVLPEKHCSKCRCPELYCADIVLGGICVDHMNFLIFRNPSKPIKDKTEKGMIRQFRICYTEAVIAVMRTNGIDFKEGFKLTRTVRLPYCVLDGTLKNYLKEIENEMESEESEESEEVDDDDLDMTAEELDAFARKYCPPVPEGITICYDEPLN